MFLGSRARPMRRADTLTADCLDNVLNISQPYRPSRPVKGITLLYLLYNDTNTKYIVIFPSQNLLQQQINRCIKASEVRTIPLNVRSSRRQNAHSYSL
jgi:hypothetical protein